ncbi:MAG: amino acid adenylation domain-containing protein, partial [Chloroflexi bacterium]|nr:amino acid adenylation domain-containing protein [Chloroflexota bacterium]
SMVGLFINTLPVRVALPPHARLIPWLQQLQAQQAQLRQYEHCPLVHIQGWSEVPRGQPLFDSILVFENYPIDALQHLDVGLRIRDVRSIEQTNYPLTIVSGPGDTLKLKISYDSRRFDADTIGRMLGHLQTVLESFAADTDQLLGSVPLLTETERHLLLVEWNDTATPYPGNLCAHQLIEAQAQRTPDAIAVTFEGQSLTYRELDCRANQLAHHLRALGFGHERLAGIYVERSPEMIIAILGVLKAGGAYLPLDPSYPRARLTFMLEDAQIAVLLTQQRLMEHLPSYQAQVICLDTHWDAIAQESEAPLLSDAGPDNLAYVIYTSGSTGTPKGVLLHHRGLCNLALAQDRAFAIGAGSRVLQFAPLSFDASVAEIFSALAGGATLCLAHQEQLTSLDDLHQLLREQHITTATLPPAVLALLDPHGLTELHVLIAAGEACPVELATRWAPGRAFFNGYGPTETTVGPSWYRVEEGHPLGTTVPVGRPITNVRLHLLDASMQPVPLGVPGELYVGGVGVARGYLNRPELTAQKFLPDPFSPEAGAQLYKTGDRMRWRADGNLEFLGRTDQQVKLRGFRIELGEIEAVLAQHPALREVVVLAREDTPGDKRLVAYIVPAEGQALNLAEVRAYLNTKLPSYMLPAAFVTLDALPLTPSGKIDRRALPAPEGRAETGVVYVPPRTPTEEIMAGIWSKALGIEPVSVADSFFDLGGHSLLATQVVSRIREAFQVELPLRELFETPTVEALAHKIEASRRADTRPLPPIQPALRDGVLPLSFAQQRLWFLDQLQPGNLAYNAPLAVRLTGKLDVAALEQSLNELVRRHEVLRTTYISVDGQPCQVIVPTLLLRLPTESLEHLSQPERQGEAVRLAREEARRPFDLMRGPLLRARLLRLAEDEHIALLTMHHIVSDGWSAGVLMREIARLYEAFSTRQPSPLPDLTIQYADFAVWQRQWLQGDVLQEQLDYWKQQLSHSPPLLELPTDHPRQAVQTSVGAHQTFTFPTSLAQALKALCQREGVTLFMTLLAAFQTLLGRYSNQDDVCVGTPIANRNRSELEDLIGFFVNTLVLRAHLSPTMSFRDLLAQVRETALGAYAHQDVPFELLVDALQPQRDMSHAPLFQVMFVLQNAPLPELLLPGLRLSALPMDPGVASFDLTLVLAEGTEGLAADVEYNPDLFDATTIARMIGNYRTLLEAIVADPERCLSQLPLLTPAEQQQILTAWNNTVTDFPRDTCIHQLVEAQAEQQPDAIAVTFEDQQLTYRELNRKANQLGHYLQALGVRPGVVVGLCVERSPEVVIGLLGVLKAGGAYLPLDPTYPPERLAFMLADAAVPVLLSQTHLLDLLPAHGARVVCLDADWPAIAREPGTPLTCAVTPDDLAYVIYTSGSTGTPKGTLLRHRGLCNLATWHRHVFGVGPGSRVLQFAPLSFDASVWETFMALRNGATLCLVRQEQLASLPELHRLMHEHHITHVTLPPSVLALLDPGGLPELGVVIAAGEACSTELVARWAPGRAFYNAYGPTETTVCASMARCYPTDMRVPSIGRPIANTRVYVLDATMQPVPLGVPGELYVGGVSVARGYLNRPELTAHKFLPDPFSPEAGARLYKTGDRVRLCSDGELGEVEAILNQHPALSEAVVLAREDTPGLPGMPGNKRLVAYVIPAHADQVPTSSELRAFLHQRLPEYMLPSAFVTLDTLPLTPSGKVDRRALPAPDGQPGTGRAYVAPRTPLEAQLAQLCAALLGVERVSVEDSFFELGGHSLLATQFISRVRETCQVELPLRALFEAPSVAELALRVQSAWQPTIEPQTLAGIPGGVLPGISPSTPPGTPPITPLPRERHRAKRSALAQRTPHASSSSTAQEKDVTERVP